MILLHQRIRMTFAIPCDYQLVPFLALRFTSYTWVCLGTQWRCNGAIIFPTFWNKMKVVTIFILPIFLFPPHFSWEKERLKISYGGNCHTNTNQNVHQDAISSQKNIWPHQFCDQTIFFVYTYSKMWSQISLSATQLQHWFP